MQVSSSGKDIGWKKCISCKKMYHDVEVDKNLLTCPKCGYYFHLPVENRIKQIVDENTFEELFVDIESKDLLQFTDSKSYADRLALAKKRLGRASAVCCGIGSIYQEKVALAVLDFSFMGGSMGRAEGEKISSLTEYALKRAFPLVIVSSSGGARMQESVFSLMQMAKTSLMIRKYKNSGGFYLSILTNPTMGGVSASFAFLGDIILAEKEALIGFAGPRVIAQTTGKDIDEKAQKAESQLKSGMIDQIISREEMKKKIFYFIKMFRKKR